MQTYQFLKRLAAIDVPRPYSNLHIVEQCQKVGPVQHLGVNGSSHNQHARLDHDDADAGKGGKVFQFIFCPFAKAYMMIRGGVGGGGEGKRKGRLCVLISAIPVFLPSPPSDTHSIQLLPPSQYAQITPSSSSLSYLLYSITSISGTVQFRGKHLRCGEILRIVCCVLQHTLLQNC